MNPKITPITPILAVAVCLFSANATARTPGSAIVRVADAEYTIPIECNQAAAPQAGFSTEPARITRERTRRSSGVRLTFRPWKETEYFVVSLDRYVAWVPRAVSSTGILEMTLNLSPASSIVNGIPQALTFDRWMAGERAEGLRNVTFIANCRERDPNAPSFRKRSGPD